MDTIEDLAGWTELNEPDKETLRAQIAHFWDGEVTVTKVAPKKRPPKVKDEDDDDEAEEKPKPAKKPKVLSYSKQCSTRRGPAESSLIFYRPRRSQKQSHTLPM